MGKIQGKVGRGRKRMEMLEDLKEGRGCRELKNTKQDRETASVILCYLSTNNSSEEDKEIHYFRGTEKIKKIRKVMNSCRRIALKR